MTFRSNVLPQKSHELLFNFYYGPHTITHHTTEDATLYEKNNQQSKQYLLLHAILIVFKNLLTYNVLHKRPRSHSNPITNVVIRI
jgi:hypothetical protein